MSFSLNPIVKIRRKRYIKDGTRKTGRSRRSRAAYILSIILCLCFLPFADVLAAAGLSLYNYQTKQDFVYTGQQVSYTFNGKSITSKNTPGIILDGNSLASFRDIFVNSGIGMKYSYEEKSESLTLTKGKNVMVMKLGSKTVLLNGKKVTAPVAPVKIEYKDRKVSKVLVPARFVAENFGYAYQWNSKTATASITEALHLNYNGKDVAYCGTQGKVTIDGTPVALRSLPVIIMEDTALLPAWRVFADSDIHAGYVYNKNTGEITITNNNTVIKMTVGSKTASVDGKTKKLDTAPLFVTNTDSRESGVMVPGSFVAAALGFNYSWNNETRTSEITAKKINDTGNQTDTGNVTLADTTFFQWGIIPELLDRYVQTSNITNTAEISEDRDSFANIDSVTLSEVFSTAGQKEVYTVHAASPISKTVVYMEGNVLKLHINNSYINAMTYNPGGVLAVEINTVFNSLDSSSEISMKLTNTPAKYEAVISEDKCTLTITLYPNYINSITAGVKSGEEFLKISAMEDMSVTLAESGNFLILQFPGTVNGIGEKSNADNNLKAVKTVTSTSVNDHTASITIEKNPGFRYRVDQTENNYTLIFMPEGTDGSDNQSEISAHTALQFKLPDGISFSDIVAEDRYRYYQNQIAILIPGDNTAFYEANPVTALSEVVQNVSVSYVYNNTEILIDTVKLQGFKLSQTENGIDVTLGDPKNIYRNIVLLDPGHGGNAAGAARTLNGVKILEKDLTLTILYYMAQKYFNAPDSDIKVYFTRYGDSVRYANTTEENYDRAAQAERIGADLYVSLHMNAHTTETPQGTEVYYSSANNSPNASGLTSKILGQMFLESLTTNLGTVKRGVKDKSLIVTRENTVPAVLIELGFMSNPQELAMLTNTEFQDTAARTIYDTLCQVFEYYPTGR